MKCVMSSPVDDSEPAGGTLMISKPLPGLSDVLVADGHVAASSAVGQRLAEADECFMPSGPKTLRSM